MFNKRNQAKRRHLYRTSISKKRTGAILAGDGADGEGLRVGDVAVRGAPAAVPGGGRRRLRAPPHEPRGRRPPPAGLPRQEPLRPGACSGGRRPHSLRIARDRQARPSQVQAGVGGRRRLAGVGGYCGHVAGGGGPPAPPRAGRHHDAVPRRPAPRQRAGPGRPRREPWEAEEGAGGVRGASVGVQVPRRGIGQHRRPQPLPDDALLHGDRVRGAGRGAPPCQGVVGGSQGEAGGQEGDGVHAARLWAWKEDREVMGDDNNTGGLACRLRLRAMVYT